MSYYGWSPYVPVATRRANAARQINQLRSQGQSIEPIAIQGRKIARTFWGEAWCTHLERFSDFENRLPRGRTYVRNGSVCHLAIGKGKIEAIVAGSELYNIDIQIAQLPASRWKKIRRQCAGRIGSMLELLHGQFSNHVMEIVTEPNKGLFPAPADIELHCDCPDWATLCKHVAAVLYGVGARLDKRPELLFVLRQVDHQALVSAQLDMQVATGGSGKRRRLAGRNLSDIFGVDIEDKATPPKKANSTLSKPARLARNKKSVPKNKASASGAVSVKPAKSPLRKKPFKPTGASVARMRKRLGMTRRQFADRVGVCPQTIAN